MEKLHSEIDKLTILYLRKMRWLVGITLISFSLNIILWKTYKYSNDVCITSFLTIGMVLLLIALRITNQSYKKKMKVLNNHKF